MRKGWEYKKLGEVCCPKSKIQRATKCFGGSDEILYIDISSIDNSVQEVNSITSFTMSNAPSRAQQKVEYGDIIVSTVRPNLKNVAVIKQHDSNLVASSGFCVLRTTDDIERNYLFRYITSDIFTQHLMKLTTGANYPAVRDLDVRDSTIPLPPKSTQIAIVSELDKINELIRLKKEQLKDFDNLAQSLFYEMFGEGKCMRKKLKDIVKIQSGQVSPLEEPYSEMIHVGPANIESNTGRLLNLKTAKEENLISGKYLFNSSMVLYSKIRPNLNKVTIPSFEGICSADMYPIIPLECIDKNFLLFLLKQKEFLTYAISNSGRANIPKINREALLNYEAILPPLSLQRLFAQRIEQIEREKSEVQKSIQDLETLLASRMQYWFE